MGFHDPQHWFLTIHGPQPSRDTLGTESDLDNAAADEGNLGEGGSRTWFACSSDCCAEGRLARVWSEAGSFRLDRRLRRKTCRREA
jgi:hypothetical protein